MRRRQTRAYGACMTAQGVRGEALQSAGERFAAAPGLLSRLVAPGFNSLINRIDAGLAKGTLQAHLPDGTQRRLGGRAAGFEATIWLNDWRGLIRLATNGVIGFYQAYEAGEWEADDHVMLLALLSANARTLGNIARSSGPFRWAARIAHRLNRNDRRGAARNIAAHYDLGNDFYAAWLGEAMSYSSAIFDKPAQSLAAGQQRKMRAIAERLTLAPGARVLEIGCGWGAQARLLADEYGAAVEAISLSQAQIAWCSEHAQPHSANGTVAFAVRDYRDVTETYDAIACVEMVEALGREYWPSFMDQIAARLKPGGRAAIQYIVMADDLFETYAGTVDFIQAYIFPGGLLIKSSEFRALAEARGLEWRDEIGFGLDYARTLKLWRERFDAAAAEGRLPPGFDARFLRLWRFYLTYCEAGFRAGNIDVHQVTLVKALDGDDQ